MEAKVELAPAEGVPDVGNQPKRSRAAYQAERRKHSYPVAFKDEAEKARFEAMAQEAGYVSFNAFLLQLLRNATSGAIYPPEYVDGLRKEVEKLRAWLDQARAEGAELRADNKALLAQKDTLVFLLTELPGGPDAMQDFERSHGKGKRAGVGL